jgi:two-component system, cell cycle sensor histidine kinase and response regulator CckA
MKRTLRVLHVEDSERDVALLTRHLARAGYDLRSERVETAAAMRAALEAGEWDVVLCDYSMPHFSAPEALRLLKETGADIPFIIISGTVGEETAVEAMRAGADDYLMKDSLTRLVPAIERGMHEAENRRARRRVEEALRESEDRYRDLVEHSHDLICTHDLEGRILSVNRTAAEALGYDREALLGRNIRDALPPEHRHEFDDYIAEIQKEGIARGLMTVRTRAGEKRVWEYTNTLRTEGVAAPIVRGVAHDVTERLRAEEALKKSEAELRAIFEAMTDVILVLDAEGRYLKIAATNANLLYRPPARLIGKTLHEVFPAEQADFFLAHVRQALRERRMHRVEYSLQIDGAEVWFDGSVSPMSGDAVVWIARDITERKRLEEQLLQSQKMEAVGQLAGGVAHDFNNLLTAINGYSDLTLRRLSPEDPLRRNVEEVRKAGERAAALTRQLLAFSRKQVLQPVALDLNALVSDMEKMLRRLIGEDVELRTALAPDLGSIKADPGQVEQVVMNLCVNARDAMPRGGHLTVETKEVVLGEDSGSRLVAVTPGPHVMLSVCDTGTGMDEETLERIFEPFFTTKEAGKGTGLGLSTVYGIVKQSGGYIEVESEVGRGTIFRVYFPRAGEGAREYRRGAEPEEVLRGGETVLLTEDEETVRRLAREVLEIYGYRVLEAANGGAAFLICERHEGPIHLLVTDVVMPEMSGRELADRLARLRPDMKVLYMSGYTDGAIVSQGVLEEGADFIHKPFAPDALARKVREVLDRS